MQWINQKAKDLSQGAIRAMFDRANAMGADDIISMGIGEPDMATPRLVCEAAGQALDMGLTHYTPNAGTMRFRQAVAEQSYLRGLHYDPASEIIATNGGMGALSLLFLVLLDPGDEVLIQDPQWLNYAAQITYCGGVPVRHVGGHQLFGVGVEPYRLFFLICHKNPSLILSDLLFFL